MSKVFRSLARSYIRNKKPLIIAVAGSVGKTTTKLLLAHILSTEKRVSYMDDSYNNGIGLYLSVFNQKVPTNTRSISGWLKIIARSLKNFMGRGPEMLILEYGIDHPGDMEELIDFVCPDIALLTAVSPEHMEYLKTIDTVGLEEAKILVAARQFGVYNQTDIDAKYVRDIKTPLFSYGNTDSDASYQITEWSREGAVAHFSIGKVNIENVTVKFIAEPLIRQLTGAALLASKLGISNASLRSAIETATPAASRMRLFKGKHESVIIDDTTNFSPNAGIEALKALKRLPVKRHIAILGNMHELGEYETKGFSDVAVEFTGLNMIVLIGELSRKYFLPLAEDKGFMVNKTIFMFDNAPQAGIFVRDLLQTDDAVLVKGPFGGFFLEEAVKKLLNNSQDSQYLTRQSAFWLMKKRQQFGDLLDQ